MEQQNSVKFASEDKKVIVYVDADTPLGILHDHLMKLKGYCVDRMVEAQKQEEEIAKKVMEESQVSESE